MKSGFLKSYLQIDYLHPKIHKIITGKIQRNLPENPKFLLAVLNICKIYPIYVIFTDSTRTVSRNP